MAHRPSEEGIKASKTAKALGATKAGEAGEAIEAFALPERHENCDRVCASHRKTLPTNAVKAEALNDDDDLLHNIA